jgi:hypothetical protein
MGHSMLTRRSCTLLLASAGLSCTLGYTQSPDNIPIRIRVDDSVSQAIPPILLRDLAQETDESDEARELARRSPATRAVPAFIILVGAVAVPTIIQMIRESLRQVYYGGVLIDARTQPPTIKSDPQVPGNMIFVIDPEGKLSRFTSDQLSPETLLSWLRTK